MVNEIIILLVYKKTIYVDLYGVFDLMLLN